MFSSTETAMAEFQDREFPDTIVLFDVDGTLTTPRKVFSLKNKKKQKKKK